MRVGTRTLPPPPPLRHAFASSKLRHLHRQTEAQYSWYSSFVPLWSFAASIVASNIFEISERWLLDSETEERSGHGHQSRGVVMLPSTLFAYISTKAAVWEECSYREPSTNEGCVRHSPKTRTHREKSPSDAENKWQRHGGRKLVTPMTSD